MKKLVTFAIVAIIGSTSVAMAQGGRGGGGERMIQMYKDSLNLTQVQTDSVKAIMESMRPKQMEIFQDQSISNEDKRAKMKSLTDERNARFAKVLSADQMKKLQEMEERMRQQRMQGGGRPQGGGGGK